MNAFRNLHPTGVRFQQTGGTHPQSSQPSLPRARLVTPECDCVLVWKFDRFARSTRHLLTALEEFDHLGIRFISVRDQVDTSSPMGKAMFTIIGAMAELESSLISERVTAGMAAAKSRAHVRCPGQRFDPVDSVGINPPSAAHVSFF